MAFCYHHWMFIMYDSDVMGRNQSLGTKNNVAENCILSENVKKANCYVFIKPKICGQLQHWPNY